MAQNATEMTEIPINDSITSGKEKRGSVFKSKDLEKGMDHKVVPLRLEWYGVNKTVKVTEGSAFNKTSYEKHILKNVSGAAEPGSLLSLMGPSGSGKTSLLNSLAKRQGVTNGKILLNGKKLPSNFHKVSAYVMQDDRLFEVLTPRELFQFSARLRLPRGTSKKEMDEMVEIVIQKLKMNACADTRVGGHLVRGLSGGERKRASIGYELITNPSLLFLDEPTSGLDSFTSLSLLSSLKDLATEGHTIICTIHQPSSDIFALFDKLILLVKGEVAYFGNASDSIGFFSSLGHPCPTYTNPADFFMALLQTQTDQDFARIKTFVDATLPTLPKPQHTLQGEESAFMVEGETKLDKGKLVTVKRSSFWTQLIELTVRGWQTVTRNPLSFKARVGQTIAVAILTGLVYLRLGDTQTNISDREGVLFFITMSQVMSCLNSVLLTFPMERALLVREQSNGMYGITSYFLGKFLSGFPLDIFFPILFSVLVYWTVGLNTTSAAPFFYFLFAIFSMGLTSSSMGMCLGCILPNAETAVSLAPIAIIPFMLFGGFFINLDSIPIWLSWIRYISVFKWGFQTLIINEMTGMTFVCTDDEVVKVTTPQGVVEICPITDGQQILDKLDFSFNDYWVAIGVLLGLFVFFRLLALFALVMQTKIALRRTQT